MAEFGEVMRNINKICKSYSECEECPLTYKNNGSHNLCTCTTFIKAYPAETEEIVMKWLKEHPLKTNADKFKEVVGFEPYNDSCVCADNEFCLHTSCKDCEYYNFWNQEYKESEEE